MSLPPCPLAVALAATFLAAAPALSQASAAAGVVIGAEGRPVRHARVCVDRDGDARCGPREPAVYTDAEGRFRLAGRGPLVAEVGTDARLVDRSGGAGVRVVRALVLRAPEAAAGGERVVGPLSTELQSLRGGPGGNLDAARHALARRLGLPDIDPARADALAATDPGQREVLQAEQAALLDRIAGAVAEAGTRGDRAAALDNRLDLERILQVVVIFAENRSFNNLYAHFPGVQGAMGDPARRARGLAVAPQRDRDGSVLAKLPPAWEGLTAAGQPVVVTQAQTTNVLPNAPFQIDAASPAWGAPAVSNAIITRDLYHRFYENQMQIAGGANDRFAAWSDAGGLSMGYFDGSHTALWKIARQYTLADDFFQGAFGGSFLNHQYLVCACAPEYPAADTAPAHPSITALRTDANGRHTPELEQAPNSPASALDGPPTFKLSGNITPKDYLGDGSFHAVNTMQPAYQPSSNKPAADDPTGRYANPLAPTTLPAQTGSTIGDMLDTRKVSWAWYSGGWNDAVADRTRVYDTSRGAFQSHHQPFNYYAAFDPASHADARAAHLKDEADLLADAAAGTLPAVAFYKPIGANNEHPGYASLAQGDAHIADVIAKLQAGPQWKHMLIVVTYDENGGQWDEIAPPHGDLVGPGTRVPALIISPFARRGYVDHTPYDTGSVLRFITHRHSLPVLAGLKMRDDGLRAHGAPAMGDLTNALDFRVRQQAAR